MKWFFVIILLAVLGGVAFYFYSFKKPDALVDQSKIDVNKKPNAEIESLHFTKFTPDKTNLEIDLNFFNPAPVGLRVDSMRYTIKMAGVRIAQSTTTNSLDIDALKRKSHTLKLTIDKEQHKRAFEKAAKKSDSTLYELDLAVFTNLPMMKGRPLRFERRKTLPAFNLPEADLKNIKLTEPGLSKTEVVLQVELKNDNSFPIGFENGFYIMKLNEDTLGTGRIDSAVVVQPKQSREMNIPLKMKTSQAIEAVKEILLQPNQTEYYYYFEADVISKSPAMQKSKTITETKAKLTQLKK